MWRGGNLRGVQGEHTGAGTGGMLLTAVPSL